MWSHTKDLASNVELIRLSASICLFTEKPCSITARPWDSKTTASHWSKLLPTTVSWKSTSILSSGVNDVNLLRYSATTSSTYCQVFLNYIIRFIFVRSFAIKKACSTVFTTVLPMSRFSDEAMRRGSKAVNAVVILYFSSHFSDNFRTIQVRNAMHCILNTKFLLSPTFFLCRQVLQYLVSAEDQVNFCVVTKVLFVSCHFSVLHSYVSKFLTSQSIPLAFLSKHSTQYTVYKKGVIGISI